MATTTIIILLAVIAGLLGWLVRKVHMTSEAVEALIAEVWDLQSSYVELKQNLGKLFAKYYLPWDELPRADEPEVKWGNRIRLITEGKRPGRVK